MAGPRCVGLTSRKIHEASEMEPKTPDKASWAVSASAGPWPRVVTFMGVAGLAGWCRRVKRRGECRCRCRPHSALVWRGWNCAWSRRQQPVERGVLVVLSSAAPLASAASSLQKSWRPE